MAKNEELKYTSAVMDFHDARRKAAIETLLARLRGESNNLLPYDEVRQMLKATAGSERGLQEIPIHAIVGSVGRYTDFTRSFLPKQDEDQSRWVRVKKAVESMKGVPPIEVYKIGEAYFVKDGNHRVSVARELDAKHIQAYVTEVKTKVPLMPDVKPDDLILKSEYADFIEHTHIDEVRPQSDLTVTAPGMYAVLEEHISVHRYYMGIDLNREVACPEALAHWYDEVYMPVVTIIRNLHLLQAFPNRTETDLYLWLSDHRESLKTSLGWDIPTEAAAEDLAEQFGEKAAGVISRVGEKLLKTLTPETLESGPRPGEWRERQTARRQTGCMFHDIFIAHNGEESGWQALDQAIEFARREGGRVYGLHVVASEAHKETKLALELEAEFKRRFAEAGVTGSLAFEVGPVAPTLVERARWADLLVVSLTYPPGSSPLAKLQSGFRTLIQRAPIPVLAVPQPIFPLESALLAYDGSPKSREALFVATYLAARWSELALTVLTVNEDEKTGRQLLKDAETYLESHTIQAIYLTEQSDDAGKAIIKAAEAQSSNLIMMGGYGHNAMLEVVIGSAVNHVLRESRRPVLICR